MLPVIPKYKFHVRLWLARILKRHAQARPIQYVGSNQGLPPPLTATEEADLMVKLREGDGTVRTPLIERNLRLVVYIARKFENTGLSVEDLVSIGAIGLIKAVNTFDPTKNIKLATYASRCIENEILMYLRRYSRIRTEVSLDEPLNTDWDGNELLLSDVIGVESDIVRRIEAEVDRTSLMMAMDRLTDREQRIVRLRYGLHTGRAKTQKEVADLLGISQSYISRLEKRIIQKLRREMLRLEGAS